MQPRPSLCLDYPGCAADGNLRELQSVARRWSNCKAFLFRRESPLVQP